MTDQNTTFGQVTTYFPAPITVSEGSSPQLYVVFEPTHWIVTTPIELAPIRWTVSLCRQRR